MRRIEGKRCEQMRRNRGCRFFLSSDFPACSRARCAGQARVLRSHLDKRFAARERPLAALALEYASRQLPVGVGCLALAGDLRIGHLEPTGDVAGKGAVEVHERLCVGPDLLSH